MQIAVVEVDAVALLGYDVSETVAADCEFSFDNCRLLTSLQTAVYTTITCRTGLARYEQEQVRKVTYQAYRYRHDNVAKVWRTTLQILHDNRRSCSLFILLVPRSV